jgi:RNA-dependent RNA polymerase
LKKKTSQKYFVVKSKIAVAKNPCMHPGDVRVLTAVDVPQLKHMVDCIVFPACGKRPITSMVNEAEF